MTNLYTIITITTDTNSTAQYGKVKINEKVEPNTRIVSAVRG